MANAIVPFDTETTAPDTEQTILVAELNYEYAALMEAGHCRFWS
jgi:hypothetical protein